MAELRQWDVFISHENSDAEVALELAARLRATGYTTWCYEDDSGVGSYLVQIDRAIEGARAVVVLVSPRSLRSPHVRNEIVRAYEGQKRFIPIRLGMAHEDLLRAEDEEDDERRREWRMAFGASVSLQWDAGDPESVAIKVSDGLRRLGVLPGGSSGDYVAPGMKSRPREVPRESPRPERTAPRPELRLPADIPAFHELLRAPMTRVAVAGVVAALGILFNAKNLLHALAPGGGPDDWVNQFVPIMRILNLAANGLGLWLNIRLARATWRLFQGDWSPEGEIRRVVDLMLMVIGGWFVVAMFTAMVGLPQGMDGARSPIMNGVLSATLLAGLQVFLLRYLFRLAGRRTPGDVPA
jgi:TIR domain-containing protein